MKLFSSRSSSSISRREKAPAPAPPATDRDLPPHASSVLPSSRSSTRRNNTPQTGTDGKGEIANPNNTEGQKKQPRPEQQQVDQQQRQSSSLMKRGDMEEGRSRNGEEERSVESDTSSNEQEEGTIYSDDGELTIDDDGEDTSLSCTVTSSAIASAAIGNEEEYDPYEDEEDDGDLDDEDGSDDDYDDDENYDEYDEEFLDDYEYDDETDVFTLIIEEGESDDEGSSSSSSGSDSDDDANSSYDRYANDNDHRELYGESGTLSSSEDEGESVSSSTLITTDGTGQEANKDSVGDDGDELTSIIGTESDDGVEANSTKAHQDPIIANESSGNVDQNAETFTAKRIGDDTTVLSNASFDSFLKMVKNGEVKSMRPIQNGKLLDRTEHVDQFLQKVEGAAQDRVAAQRSKGEYKEDAQAKNQEIVKKISTSSRKGWQRNFLKFTLKSRNRSKKLKEQQEEVRGRNEPKKSRSLSKEVSKKATPKQAPEALPASKVPQMHPKSTSKSTAGSTAILNKDEIDELVAQTESIPPVQDGGVKDMNEITGGTSSSPDMVPDGRTKPMPIEYNDEDGEQVTLQPPLERVDSEESYSLAEYLFMQALSMTQSVAEPNEEPISINDSPQKPSDDAHQAICSTKSMQLDDDVKISDKADDPTKQTEEKNHDKEIEPRMAGQYIPLPSTLEKSFSGKLSIRTTKNENNDEKNAASTMAGQEIPLSPSLEESLSLRQPESASVEKPEPSGNEETFEKTAGKTTWTKKMFGSRTRSKEAKGTGLSRTEGSLQKFRSFMTSSSKDQVKSTHSLPETETNTHIAESNSSKRHEKPIMSRKKINCPKSDGQPESQPDATFVEHRKNPKKRITGKSSEQHLYVLPLNDVSENDSQPPPTSDENDSTEESIPREITEDHIASPTEPDENLGWMSFLQPFIAFGGDGESRAPINEPRESSVDHRRAVKESTEDELTYLGIETSVDNFQRGQKPTGASYTVPLRDADTKDETASPRNISSDPSLIASRRNKKKSFHLKAAKNGTTVPSHSSKKLSPVSRDKKRNGPSKLRLEAARSSDLILSRPMSRLPSASSTKRSRRFSNWRGKKKDRCHKARVDKVVQEPSLLYVMTTKKKTTNKKGGRRRGSSKNKNEVGHHQKVFYTVEVGRDLPEN